jgi:hypothetical protein
MDMSNDLVIRRLSEQVSIEASDPIAKLSGLEELQYLDQAIAALNGGQAIPEWVIHDLRRSVASGMARLGINLPIIEKPLNHVSGSFAGVVGIYQRHDFAQERRVALGVWARHVVGLGVCA